MGATNRVRHDREPRLTAISGDMKSDVGDYLEELRLASNSPNTIRLRSVQLGRWCHWLAGSGQGVREATRDDVIAFLLSFANSETRSAYRSALRGFHAWLVEAGRRPDDPAANLPKVHRRPGRPHPVPDAVVMRALQTCNPTVASMLHLGRFAGLRAAEIAEAHRDSLRGGDGFETLSVHGKGDKWRDLPAHPTVVDAYRRATGYLYPSRLGGDHLTPGRVSQLLALALGPPWTAHCLRHAFATEAYMRTKDVVLVQKWLGHSDPRTTLIYVGVDQNHAAMRSLGFVA